MKKFNFSAFIVLVCFILFYTSNIYAQRWVSTKVEKRKVVLEEFTGIHCGYCPDGHKIANNLAKNNPGNVFLVNIHAGGYATPKSGEVDLRVDDATSLMQNMGVSSFPIGAVNRELVNTGQKNEWVLNRGYWEYVSSLIMKELMPIANSYSISECLEACDYYFEKTKRRVSFEYSLVAGVNDNDEEAEELAALLRGHNGHVNLIPVNPIKERDFKRSDKTRIFAFQNKLEKNGINVTIRREMGRDIDGACGQLRRRHNEEARGLNSDKGCI